MQSEHEFQEWCWRRARLVFAPICFLGILNIIFQSVFFPYIFYTLFWTLSPFVWIFQVPLILAFVVIYIIIWRREVFNFTTPAYLVLYTLLFLFTLLFGILLYAIPDVCAVFTRFCTFFLGTWCRLFRRIVMAHGSITARLFCANPLLRLAQETVSRLDTVAELPLCRHFIFRPF